MVVEEENLRALIFDLDGTLVDTVYAHIFAWQRALAEAGMPLEGWRIHRKIGMSGGLMTNILLSESGFAIDVPAKEHSQGVGSIRDTRPDF